MASLISVDADSAWPSERVYNFKITSAGLKQPKTGANTDKYYVALQLEITNSPEANGEVCFLNLMTFNKRGERDLLALIKAVTGSPLTGQHELDGEAIQKMLSGGLFQAKLVHDTEDDEITGVYVRGPFKSFDPELENEEFGSESEFSNSF